MRRLPARLKGGSLLYTLMIILIVSGLIGAYIWMNALQRHYLDRQYQRDRAERTLHSGIERYLAEYATQPDSVQFQLFDEQVDTFQLRREPWGLFELAHTKAIYGRETASRSLFLGAKIPTERQFSLFLADQKAPLSMVGQAQIRGLFFLPSAGIRPAYVGQRRFEGQDLYVGTRRSSRGKRMELSGQHLDKVLWELRKLRAYPPSGELYAWEQDSINQAWDTTVYEVFTQGDLNLKELKLKGKILIRCGGTLTIDSTAALENVLIFANRLHIKSGFQGKLQAFASEGIVLDSRVHLAYPSVLMITRPEKQSAELIVGPYSQVEGALLFQHEGKEGQSDYVKIDYGAQVYGQVYTSHNLDLRGRVWGSVATGSFLLKTPGSIYQNHLLDGQMDFSGLSSDYTGPFVSLNPAVEIVSWLSN